MSNYTEEYYNTLNYENYLERELQYVDLVTDVTKLMEQLNLLKPDDKRLVLDYGCAVGFVAGALINMGHNAYGVDVSDWALSQAKERGIPCVKEPFYDIEHKTVFALDVLEHLDDEQLGTFFSDIKTDSMVFRVPICAVPGEDYVFEESRKDPTHIQRMTAKEWKNLLNWWGYNVVELNLPNLIWCSEGVYAGIAIRKYGI